MLAELSDYAEARHIDALVLVSDHVDFYQRSGFVPLTTSHQWLKLHEHRHYGIAHEEDVPVMVKPLGGKTWPQGEMDWLGYLY